VLDDECHGVAMMQRGALRKRRRKGLKVHGLRDSTEKMLAAMTAPTHGRLSKIVR
jgi:hypothetical protein